MLRSTATLRVGSTVVEESCIAGIEYRKNERASELELTGGFAGPSTDIIKDFSPTLIARGVALQELHRVKHPLTQ